MKDVKVYAQNLRSYNMGLDQGRWITLGIGGTGITKNPNRAVASYRKSSRHGRFLIIRQILKSVNMKIYMN